MATIKTFEDLEIWKKAQQLAAEIYFLVESNEKINRDFSFKDQIKRAVLSISNNIAEGFEYNNNKDFIKFLRYAKGSSGEVRNCLLFAASVNFVQRKNIQSLIESSRELGNRIGSLIKYLQTKTSKKQ
jgi:four helix bundle protein